MKLWLRNQFKLFTLFFTSFLVLGEIALVYRFVRAPAPLTFAAALLAPYAIPVAMFRLVNWFRPIREGAQYVGKDYYSPWLTAHRFQMIFLTFPSLEKLLHMIPGAFSFWLRLWGSKIGKGVMWTPHVEVLDRSHLDIGDNVFFGNKAYLSPHIVRASGDKRFFLYFKTVKVGSHSFVGAWSRLGPGAEVPEGSEVPGQTDLRMNQKFVPAARAEGGREGTPARGLARAAATETSSTETKKA